MPGDTVTDETPVIGINGATVTVEVFSVTPSARNPKKVIESNTEPDTPKATGVFDVTTFARISVQRLNGLPLLF